MEGEFSFVGSINVVVVLYAVFFVASLTMGVFVYSKNPGARTARIFFLLCIAFSILHVGEIFFSWSSSKSDAFAFTALKSVGFVFWWPLSLHFFLSIREQKLGPVWFGLLLVLYTYSFACVVGFFLGINHAADYVRDGIVWIDKPYWSLLALPYLGMMPVCLTLSISVLISIRNRAVRDKNELLKRQIDIILFSGIPSALVGLFFNIVMPNLGVTVPSIGHMFIGLWILAIGYAISKYRFLVPTLEFASRQVFTIAAEMIVITDMRFMITEFNRTFTAKLGYPHGERLSLAELIDSSDAGSELNLSTCVSESLWQIRSKDGDIVHVKKKGAILYDNSLEIGVVFVLSDISELRKQNLLLEDKVQERTKEIFEAKQEAERRLKITEVYTRRSVVELIRKGGDPRVCKPQFYPVAKFQGRSESQSPDSLTEGNRSSKVLR